MKFDLKKDFRTNKEYNKKLKIIEKENKRSGSSDTIRFCIDKVFNEK